MKHHVRSRRWVDALGRAAVDLITNSYILVRAEMFEVVSLEYIYATLTLT